MYADRYRQPLSLRGASLCDATWQSHFITVQCFLLRFLRRGVASPRNDMIIGDWLQAIAALINDHLSYLYGLHKFCCKLLLPFT